MLTLRAVTFTNHLLPLTLCLSLITSGAFAQITYAISGTVRDSATGKPLVRAAVVIDYEKVTTGTYTDDEDHYAVKVRQGQRILVVRYVGYVPFRTYVRVQGDTRFDVRLPSVASQLEAS